MCLLKVCANIVSHYKINESSSDGGSDLFISFSSIRRLDPFKIDFFSPKIDVLLVLFLGVILALAGLALYLIFSLDPTLLPEEDEPMLGMDVCLFIV